MISLIFLGFVLGYAGLRFGGVLTSDWKVCLFALGMVGIGHWLAFGRSGGSPPTERWFKWPVRLLFALILIQLLPLPLEVVRLLSPARAQLADYLAPLSDGVEPTSLSVFPAATTESAIAFGAYLMVFLVVRDVASRASADSWRIMAPLVVVAASEAAYGLSQIGSGGPVHGTYVNRNNFAGLLDMAFPIGLMYSVASLRRIYRDTQASLASVVKACLGMGTVALLLAGVIASLSRTGLLAVAVSVTVSVALSIRRSSWKARWVGVVALNVVGVLMLLAALTPERLTRRFISVGNDSDFSLDVRLDTWQRTTEMIRDYSLVGCGLGAYESAFGKYQNGAPDNAIDYAHNDFLQLAAELGVIGLVLATTPIVGLLRGTLREAGKRSERRDEAVSAVASMLAIGAHSMFDFSLHIPANAMGAAWVAGFAAGLSNGSATTCGKKRVENSPI